MDKGGGGTNTVTSDFPDFLKPYASSYLNQAQQTSNRPLQQYPGQTVADLAPGQQTAIQNINNLAGGIPSMQTADQMLGETLSGQGMNPYLDSIASRVIGDAAQAYQGQTGQITQRFNTPGNWGGSAQMGAQDKANAAFARGMGDSLSQLFSQGYENERNRQMQAVPLVGGLYQNLEQGQQAALGANETVRAQNQKILDALQGKFTQAQNYPEHQLDIYGQALSPLFGGGYKNSTSTGPGADPVSQALGLGLGAGFISQTPFGGYIGSQLANLGGKGGGGAGLAGALLA